MFPFVSTKNIDMVTARDHTWLESVKIFCPNLPYWKFRIFFIFFLLNRNVIFAAKLQKGLYFGTSTAKMWNPNIKYYTYPERSWYELFKTAKKFQNFSHLSFWTYWMKKSQKNYSAQPQQETTCVKNHRWLNSIVELKEIWIFSYIPNSLFI